MTHEHDIAAATERVIRVRDGRIEADLSVAEFTSATAGSPARLTGSPLARGRGPRRARARRGLRAGRVSRMFSREIWFEILDTLRKNKLRTALTGFSVAWGILMLVVLLGSGQGLGNGIEYQFRDDATNSIWVFPGTTSVPFAGKQPGRNVQLTNADHVDAARKVSQVEHITSRFPIRGATTVRYGKEVATFNIRSVHPAHQFLEKTEVAEGRFLNDIDIREFRKVASIGSRVQEQLFGKESPVGKEIYINNIAFKVVGTFTDAGAQGETRGHLPPDLHLAEGVQRRRPHRHVHVHHRRRHLPQSEASAQEVRGQLAERHDFDPRTSGRCPCATTSRTSPA